MAQSSYFNETCDPEDLTLCSGHYTDPCNCKQFFHCDNNQHIMFRKTCGSEEMYNHYIKSCGHPDYTICQNPWKRCNVSESRMEQLRSMCIKSTPNNNNSVPITLLLTVFGVLVPVIIIGIVIYRYQNRRPSCGVGINLLTPARISTISDGSLGTSQSSYDDLFPFRVTRFTRNHESHLLDPYNSLDSVASSIHEYGPYPTQRFNPMFGVDPVYSGRSSYIIVEEFDSTPRPSTMLGASDDDHECIARGFHFDNRTEIETVSYEDSFNSITGQSATTHHPLPMSRPCEADRPDTYLNSQEENTIASGNGGSYVFVTPAVPQPSDADRKLVNINVSSARSVHLVVQRSDPLFPPYSRRNFQRAYKFIFSTRKHFISRPAELTPCNTLATA